MGVLLAGIVLFALATGSTFTPLFAARHIRVEGNRTLSPDDVSMLAGVSDATNVFHLDIAATEAALEDDPWIASAKVTRDLPATVILRVTERTPVAVAGAAVVAADGTALPGASAQGLPNIGVLAGALDPEERTAGAGAVGAMAPVVRDRVESVLVEPDGDLVLILRDGATVRYGQPEETIAKAEALRAVLRWAGEHDVAIASADVSVPNAPTLQPVDGSTVTP
jgi:cell division protein FtsQ